MVASVASSAGRFSLLTTILAETVHGTSAAGAPSSDGNSIRALIQASFCLLSLLCVGYLCLLWLGNQGGGSQSARGSGQEDPGIAVAFV